MKGENTFTSGDLHPLSPFFSSYLAFLFFSRLFVDFFFHFFELLTARPSTSATATNRIATAATTANTGSTSSEKRETFIVPGKPSLNPDEPHDAQQLISYDHS